MRHDELQTSPDPEEEEAAAAAKTKTWKLQKLKDEMRPKDEAERTWTNTDLHQRHVQMV